MVVNGGHSVRDDYTCQTITIAKGTTAYCCELTVAVKSHTCQTIAFIDCVITNALHTRRDKHHCNCIIIIKSSIVYCGDSIRDDNIGCISFVFNQFTYISFGVEDKAVFVLGKSCISRHIINMIRIFGDISVSCLARHDIQR